jgi:hypothetical protein
MSIIYVNLSLLLISAVLQTTSFKTATEDLLELRNVVKVHESIMLPRNVSVRRLTTAETIPRLQLLVQPISLASAQRNGIEDVKNS